MNFYTIDFETEKIRPRPFYPPRPVGVSIKLSTEKKSHYYAWGHPTENNCTEADAVKALKKVWQSGLPIVCHNTKFDYEVATDGLDLPELPWDRLHDTMIMLFLDFPHAPSFALKPAAERILGLKPEERDAVRDWLIENQGRLREEGLLPEDEKKITKTNFGAWISLAPGKLVGTYANGDVIRTEKLFVKLWKSLSKRKMLLAYDAERELLPILLKMEQQGVPVDLKRLRTDVKLYQGLLVKIDLWLRKQLKLDGDAKLKNGEVIVEAMIRLGKVDETKLQRTDTGKWSSDKESLAAAVTDKKLAAMLQYNSQLQTCVGTYMAQWLEMAELSKGFIYTSWNQTRSADGRHSTGTRTGRLSATWFMNIPKEFKPIFKQDVEALMKATTDKKELLKLKKLLKETPSSPFELPPLPLCRSYITPWEKSHVLLDRDYSQQEPRILGHFEGGSLMEKYNAEPWIDFHDFAKAELEKMGLFYERKPVKNTNLGLIYGMGTGKLAEKNDMTVDEASQLKKAILTLYPGLKDMYAEMRARAKNNEPIRTWGGREYYCEEPKIINGRTQTYDYKMVNTLIQGSAADCTKRALIRLWNFIQRDKRSWKVLLTVHDEILMSAPEKEMTEAMETLRLAMEGVEFRVPMLSEGTISKSNWASLVDYDVKGKVVYKKSSKQL